MRREEKARLHWFYLEGSASPHFCSLGSPLSATCGVQTSSRKLQRTTGVQRKSTTRDVGQYQRRKKETMSEERREKLNSIGFTWKVREAPFLLIGKSAFSNLWSTNEFTEIATYHRSTKQNPQLGLWVRTNEQRRRQ